MIPGGNTMNTTMYPSNHRISLRRIMIAVVVAIILVATALFLYQANQTADAPVQSTTEMQPSNAASDDVTRGGNPADDATPDPTGTGGNTILMQ